MSWPLSPARRIRAPLLHAAVCVIVAALASALVFWLWFPGAYAKVTGGLTLFLILVSVDVVSGPLLTAVIADEAKPAKTFRRDVLVVAFVQMAALAYGVYVLSLARPVATVFEVDRMHVLSAAEVDPEALLKAPAAFRTLSWTGPRLLAAKQPRSREEELRAIDLALAGMDIGNEPKNWQPYDSQNTAAWNRARPLVQLTRRYPQAAKPVETIAKAVDVPIEQLRFLPLTARQGFGSAVLAPPDFRVVAVLDVDGFF
jgi:hypothetical protein